MDYQKKYKIKVGDLNGGVCECKFLDDCKKHPRFGLNDWRSPASISREGSRVLPENQDIFIKNY